MTYSLHRGAELDILEAARFYRREGGAKLAGRFLDEFHRVVTTCWLNLQALALQPTK
jgi:hypothetical protein